MLALNATTCSNNILYFPCSDIATFLDQSKISCLYNPPPLIHERGKIYSGGLKNGKIRNREATEEFIKDNVLIRSWYSYSLKVLAKIESIHKFNFSSPKRPIFLDACARSSELSSDISARDQIVVCSNKYKDKNYLKYSVNGLF